MQINLGNYAISEDDADLLIGLNPSVTVYSVDECDEIHLRKEAAMSQAEDLAEDWAGDLIVSEYSINIGYDPDDPRNEESRGYYLIDWQNPPLNFTGKYWVYDKDTEEWEER